VDSTKGETKLPWGRRKSTYIQHLQKDSDRGYHLVSASDKLHNLQCILRDYRRIGAELWSRFSSGRDNSLWYYGQLIRAFEQANLVPSNLLSQLQTAYAELTAAVASTEGFSLAPDYTPPAG
jgi:hypothetical protein